MPAIPKTAYPFLSGEELGGKNVKALIVDEGFIDNGGKYGRQRLVVGVKADVGQGMKRYNVSLSGDSAVSLSDHFESDSSDKWVGKEIILQAVQYVIDGKTVVGIEAVPL